MFLEVAVDNDKAIRMYQKHLFEEVGTRKDYYRKADGSRGNAYTMRCDLVAACCHKPRLLASNDDNQ